MNELAKLLLSGAQGASNAVASNVSGPVDLISWALRKGGVPVPDNPVGGSNWMAQHGFVQQPQNKLAGLLGEAVGGVLPAVVSAKAPQIAGGLLRGAENLSTPSRLRKEAGVIDATFIKGINPKNSRETVVINDDGSASIFTPGFGFNTLQDWQEEVFDAAREKFGTKYDHYFRFTNNKEELSLAKAGLLNPSKNHRDGFIEKGLSVAYGPEYGIAGYKYGYPVMGRFSAWGSDGEPLLHPESVKVLSDRLLPAMDIVRADKLKQSQLLKAAGLPADYFSGVRFLNNQYSFEPIK